MADAGRPEDLERLDRRIEEAEERLEEETGLDDDEPRFSDTGERGPVDDAIAPPG